MNWISWLVSGIWVVGMFISLRRFILKRYEVVERHLDADRAQLRNDKNYWCRRTSNHDFWGDDPADVFFPLAIEVVLWPIYLIMSVIRFLMFPRGITTKYAKEKQLERRNAEAEKRILEAEERIRQTNAQISAGHIAIGVDPLECPYCKARELEITP